MTVKWLPAGWPIECHHKLVRLGPYCIRAGLSTSDVTGPKVLGHCLCGETEFEVTVPPKLSSYCHCVICQKSDAKYVCRAAMQARAREFHRCLSSHVPTLTKF
jgi:hypothetical protein